MIAAAAAHSRAAATSCDPDLHHAVETAALLSHQDDLDGQAFALPDPRGRPPLARSALHPLLIFQPPGMAAGTQWAPGEPAGLHGQGLPQSQRRSQPKQLPEEPVEGDRICSAKASAQPQLSAGRWGSGGGGRRWGGRGRRRRRRGQDGCNGAWGLYEH